MAKTGVASTPPSLEQKYIALYHDDDVDDAKEMSLLWIEHSTSRYRTERVTEFTSVCC